ncbi:MAG TPA: DUF1707 domain-containing protein [Pseudonocardiaceae bacterium]
MTSPDAMRASDGDRERVVQALQEQVGEGRLTLQEFEERSTAVYEAKTVGDLRKLLADLPVDVFAQPTPPPFAMGAAWQQPFPMPAIPPWQQQRIVRAGGRPNPVLFIALAFIVFAAVGSALTVAPYLLPIALFGFFMLRAAARGGGRGRRYPPYGR